MTGVVLAVAGLVLSGAGVLACLTDERNWFSWLDRIGGQRCE